MCVERCPCYILSGYCLRGGVTVHTTWLSRNACKSNAFIFFLCRVGGGGGPRTLTKCSHPASCFKEQSPFRFAGAQKGIQSYPLWIVWYEPVLSVRYLSEKSVFKKLVLVWHYLLSKKREGCQETLSLFAASSTAGRMTYSESLNFSLSSSFTGRTVSQCILSFMLPICSVLCFFGQGFPLFLQQGM